MDYLAPDTPEILKKLFKHGQHLFKHDLDSMHQGVKYLFEGKDLPKIILVGGTNGKGSTSGFLWHLFGIGERKTGLFTSPHLCSYKERFQISDGSEVSDVELAGLLQAMTLELGEELYESLSFFEISTLLAIKLFTLHQCQWIILEVGLGGRLDATNAFEPELSVITSIDLDHQQILGNTKILIAEEKLGIKRPNKPLFIGKNLDPDVYNLIKSEALISNTPLIQAKQMTAYPHWVEQGGNARKENFDLACGVYRHLFDETELSKILSRGFPNLKTPWAYNLNGRLQWLEVSVNASRSFPLNLLLDGSHNEASVEELLKYCKYKMKTLPQMAFVSILKDKALDKMLSMYTQHFSEVVLFATSNPRSFQPSDLPERYKKLPFFANFTELLSSMMRKNALSPEPLLVSGSLYAIGEVISYFDAFPKNHYFHPHLRGYQS